MSTTPLDILAKAVETIPGPRSKQGVTHPYHGMIALGLLAGIPYVSPIRRGAIKYWHTLRPHSNSNE